MPKMNINEVKNIINSRLSDARDDKKNGVDRLAAMAEAYAYWFILDEANAVNQNVELENDNEVPDDAQNAQTINIDENELNNKKNYALGSLAFDVALKNRRVDELTGRSLNTITTHINYVKDNIDQYNAGNEKSANRAQSVLSQFESTWRIKRNSSEFNAAKRAMRDIAQSQDDPTRSMNFLAGDTVKKYVAKNIRKAKSAVGITRMACALAFIKQTMTEQDFKIYCRNMNVLRGNQPLSVQGNEAVFDRTDPRCIVPEEIGTVAEVYHNARERFTVYQKNKEKIDTRDIAILYALKNIEKNSPEGKNKIVEHETLQAEIQKIQNKRAFREFCERTPRDELIMMAWEHKFDNSLTPTLDEYHMNQVLQDRQNAIKAERELIDNQHAVEDAKILADNAKYKAEALEIKKKLDEQEAEKKKIEEQNRKQKELEERRKTARTFEELSAELLPAMEKYAEPAKLKEEAELKKKDKDMVENLFDDIIINPAPKKKGNKELDEIFDELNENPTLEKEKLDTFAKFVVVGKFFFKEKEEREKNKAKKTESITIKLDDFKKEVSNLKKNPDFKNIAKEIIDDPKFSENALNCYKNSKESDVKDENQRNLRAVLLFCASLNTKYEKKLDFLKKRPLKDYYSDMNGKLKNYLDNGNFDKKDGRLKTLVYNAIVLRNIEKEVGPNGAASPKEVDTEVKKLKNIPDIDSVINTTMQTMKTLSIDSKLRRESKRPDFPQFFSEVVEKAYEQAVESVKRMKPQKTNIKANY